ncbi:uncharacterized protein KIAA1143 homolog [Neodiprion lecontei]|uniref:Uncharacterized protein KIAA1143 homolog n=1 Tax=Neodiprion lecontei TaxID=441921 RepID=A0A6J0C0E5_NEOLC|nr:uncharacterized protein KIAA1143 homolog [Neodiprion lecontei]
MSKRKHNIAYIKPDEPKFLRELKAKVGYKEGPSIETKKEALPTATDEDYEDRDEELPTVVVLNNGDLTAEEAAAFELAKEKEEAQTPADLSKKIIFTKTKSAPKDSKKNTETESSLPKKSKKSKKTKVILSFNEDEED